MGSHEAIVTFISTSISKQAMKVGLQIWLPRTECKVVAWKSCIWDTKSNARIHGVGDELSISTI
jgi:hypothetical protein